MAKKIEKSLSWLTVLVICFLIVFGVSVVLEEILADTNVPSVTVGNSSPTLGTVILNGGNAITVTENNYITISGTTTVSDDNGYADIISATSVLFLNNTTTGCSSGGSDPNWCYYVSSCATSSCSELICILTCSANVWFVAEPSTASSTYPTKAWQMNVTVLDSGSNATTGTTSQELNITTALDFSTGTNYSTVNPGATSSNITTNATNTGNYHVDVQFSGVDMQTGGATASIDVGQQKYSSSTMSDWTTEGVALSGSPTTYDLTLPKPTATTSNSTDDVYWVISIPTSTSPGIYTGTNTADAIWASS